MKTVVTRALTRAAMRAAMRAVKRAQPRPRAFLTAHCLALLRGCHCD